MCLSSGSASEKGPAAWRVRGGREGEERERAAGRAPRSEGQGAAAGSGLPAASMEQLGAADLLIVGLLIGLILISVVGNCLVCVAIFTDKRLRKLGNAFIVSLAIADLFVSCLVMTFALCNDLMNYWIFGDWFCDVWISFDIMCCTASILNLCAISLDRFVHIKDCLLYNQWMTRRVAISAVIIIWFTSALVSFVPINLGWHKPHHFGAKSQPQALEALKQTSTLLPASGQLEAKLNYFASKPSPIENQSSLRLAAGGQPANLSRSIGGQQSWTNTGLAREPDFVSSSTGSSSGASRSANQRGQDPSRGQARQQWQRRRRRRRRRRSSSPATQVGRVNSSGGQPAPASAKANQVQFNPRNGSHTMAIDSAGLPAPSAQDAAAPLGGQQMPVCVLTLTPTYAVISSTISFYIPCIIMLGLYTKLFACARRHVKNIQAISKVPAPISAPSSLRRETRQAIALDLPQPRPTDPRLPVIRSWLKFCRPRGQPNAQSNDNSKPGGPNGNSMGQRAEGEEEEEETTLEFERAEQAASSERASADEIQSNQLGPARHGNLNPAGGNRWSPSRAPLLASQSQQLGPEQVEPPNPAYRAGGDNASSASLDVNRSRASEGRPEERPFLTQANAKRAHRKLSSFRLALRATSDSQQSIGPTRTTKMKMKMKTKTTYDNFSSYQQHQHHQQQQQQQQNGQLATHKAAITLGIIMGTFLFCWVPFFCLNIIKAFCVDCIPGSLFKAFTWLGYANSALNPIIYGIHNTEFRNAFNRIFFKHLNIKNSRYYLDRRFSYDLRHASNPARNRARDRRGQLDGGKQSNNRLARIIA